MSSLPAAYLHHPSLQGDQIVFVADDDLWRVDHQGGRAERLSDGLGEPSCPCLSPDGRWLAYTGRDEGAPEVWLMPAAGGQARRMTWLGADTATRGWTPDGRILFVSNHGQPFFRNSHAFTLATGGGDPERLDCGQVDHLAFGPQGQRVIGRNTADPARWKRYRGGRVGQLWVDAEGHGDFHRLSALQGNPSHPMWLDGRLWFIGDAEGVGNLYSCRPDGSGLQRHTEHSTHYARWASTDGRRIVYQCAAELWLFDPAQGRSRRLEVEVPAARKQSARRLLPAAANLQGWRLHPQGHSLALELRGQLHTMALWEGAARRHDEGGAARCRLGQWLADGRRLVGVCDATGEERLVVYGEAQRVLDLDIGRVTAMVAAPVGACLAVANHRNELLLVDAEAGTSKRLDHSEFGAMEGLAWSPDGAWLAYSCWTSMRHRAIRLCELASGTTTLVSQAEFQDYSPAFDPEGRWLYFLSIRTFDPVYDAVQFELSFPRAARPYLVALQAGGPVPFEPEPRGLKKADGKGAAAPRGEAVPAAGEGPRPLKVDLEGLQRRVAAFPVPENLFGRLAGAADGKVLWTVLPVAGAHGRGGHKAGPGRLEVFDLASGRVQTLADKADHFELAADHATVVVREGERLRAHGLEPRPDDDAAHDDKPSRRSGWIDLERTRVSVSPPEEWQQMLREAWRLQRDHFWVEDMSGVDWPAVWARYAPLLPRVATRGELSDLMWELQGELGTSHAYEYGGDHRKPPPIVQGLLAADLRHDDDGAEILHLVRGDPWDAAADSPLLAIGVEARAGDRITAVGGLAVSRRQPVGELLLQRAGGKVVLSLSDGQRVRQVLVKPLADEAPARYREWVERHRTWVHLQSGGRVGYFHVPDMMSAGFAEFHRYFATECDRDALIVDVRYNRGGHVSQLLLEKVARRRIAWATQRWGRPTPYPEAAAAGPVVALTNEHAGSDGDIFSHGFKLMGIGDLVGQRTWGGVIGIWPRHPLVDGSTVTQPEYSFWFKDVGWQVENYGTDPTIVVENRPQDAAAGRDRQLEVALQTALQALEHRGAARADFGPRPQLAPPPLMPLPPR